LRQEDEGKGSKGAIGEKKRAHGGRWRWSSNDKTTRFLT